MALFKTSQHKKAVAYYRHSAEDKQENSVPLQRDFVREFLKKHDVELIHEEKDEGVSGLTANRPGFQRLLNDWILNPSAPAFDYVVYYDVSRQGRFEDADEAGHYEFQCKQMGKQVIYARRGFPTDEQKGMSQVQTAFERWMSFKYSEKLSEDVIRGCLNISSQGYSVGGHAPYGFAQLLLSADNRTPIRIMRDGEHKSVANERITFVPKNDDTTETVKNIFRYFFEEKLGLEQIVDELNRKGVLSFSGGTWNKGKIFRILTNPAYKGTLLYNKTWGRLKRKRRRNPLSDFIIFPNAFPAIIEPNLFDKAQEQLYWLLPSKYQKGSRIISKAKTDVLRELRGLLEKKGIDPEYTKTIPITFAVKRRLSNQSPYWCFFISRQMERNKKVICMSLDMEKEDFIDRIFLLPTKAFNLMGMCFFTEEHALSTDWIQKDDCIEETILSLLKEQVGIEECDELIAA